MGYRQYIYSVDSWLVEEIRKCKTVQDFIKTIQKFRNEIVEWDPIDEKYYVPIYELGDTLHEFGKYWENSDEMYRHGDSLFQSDELNEYYSDYGAIVLDEEGMLCAIEWYRKHVFELYEDLLREKSNNEWDSRSQFERLVEHARDYRMWWRNAGPGNLNKECEKIVSSWLYEHAYFELVRIYKTFDWDNKCMIFMGW